MKSFLMVSLLLTCGFVGGYFFRTHGVPAAQGESEKWTPALQGDVNGDGTLNIGDAMFILDFCFRKGPPPPALASARRGLPVTGQVHCWSGARGEKQDPCPQPGMDDYGQDANFLDLGIPHDFELVKGDEDDVATWFTIDHGTGLMWQYTSEFRGAWTATLKHAEEFELGNFDDWRLPNVKELFSIVDVSEEQPSIDRDFFMIFPVAYWTSSTCIFDPSRAYTVRFNNGFVTCTDKGGQGQASSRLFSLLVRSLD